jgi:hypothetical protein
MFVTCVVETDAIAVVFVAFVVVEEVQPAIRRPQNMRQTRTRDVRIETMFSLGMLSRLLFDYPDFVIPWVYVQNLDFQIELTPRYTNEPHMGTTAQRNGSGMGGLAHIS